MSDETMVEQGKLYDVMRVDQEVLIVTDLRPAVFDGEGRLLDAGIDVARLGADGVYHPSPVRIIEAVVLLAEEE